MAKSHNDFSMRFLTKMLKKRSLSHRPKKAKTILWPNRNTSLIISTEER